MGLGIVLAGVKPEKIVGHRTVICFSTDHTVPSGIAFSKIFVLRAVHVWILAVELEPLSTGFTGDCTLIPLDRDIAGVTGITSFVARVGRRSWPRIVILLGGMIAHDTEKETRDEC